MLAHAHARTHARRPVVELLQLLPTSNSGVSACLFTSGAVQSCPQLPGACAEMRARLHACALQQAWAMCRSCSRLHTGSIASRCSWPAHQACTQLQTPNPDPPPLSARPCSKKIAIPKNTKLKCITWNTEQVGWARCGALYLTRIATFNTVHHTYNCVQHPWCLQPNLSMACLSAYPTRLRSQWRQPTRTFIDPNAS